MATTRWPASPRHSNTITSPSRHPRCSLTSQLAILLFSIITPVASTPISYFPLNSQLPPVARVSEPFSFIFSPLTFSSDTEMKYALADGSPSWLSLDSTARRLSGTPDEASVPSDKTLVGVVITLIASDATGSTAANATLVVSRSSEPSVRIPLEDQIDKFGPYSAPASVLLHPSSEFNFEFDPYTFGVGGGNGNGQGKTRDIKREEDRSMSKPKVELNYYAVSGNNAPLPSWIEFDAEKLAFSGKTPSIESLVQAPQRFDFKLVASDVIGFSSTSIGFSIMVGRHELTAEEPIIELNATRGKRLEYTRLPNIIKLDKQPLVQANVSSITADGLPPWLSFDEKSWKVSGTPDTKARPANVTIAVVDKFFDILNVTLAVNFHTPVFVSDVRRDLYWLLVIPVMLAAITIILVIFRVRKRRHQPRKLDFSEVSGPVPGSFVANSFAGVTFDAIRKTLDMGPHAPLPRQNGYAPTVDSGQRSQASVNPTIEIDDVTPHALTHSEAIKPAHQAKASTGKRDSWLTTRQGRPSPAGSDEISLLSDETFRAEVHTAQEVRSSRTQKPGEIFYGKKTAPDAPATAEPFSIQPTPELAYTAAKRYDFVSDDETPPTVGYAARRGSVRRQNQSPSHHGVQHRLSKAWKLGSPSKLLSNVKRHSHLSSSTNETTRTSILSSGVSKEATTASANVVTKPTVILIPSRPGEARQVSRRTEDSVSFFGGGSLTRSHRNFGLEKDTASEHPPRGDLGLSSGIREPDGVRDGATVWDPLGIAYQDLQTKRTTKELVANPEKPRMGSIQSENWSTYPTHESLMSPSRWPIPDAFIGLGGTPDVFRNPNEPPQVPPPKLPATAKLPGTLTHIIKNSAGGARRPSRESGSMSSLSQTPSTTHKRSKSRSPHEERLRISRIREQRALDEFRAMMESQTPSPSGEWAAPRAGQAPETPSRTGRAPLADRPNGSGGLKSSLSKRSVKTVRSAKSVRSAWVGEDDDDAWEDVLPPQSMIGEWERAESDGSFPVYI